jgi:hypothetical protein
MSTTTKSPQTVSPDEAERRVAEYRRLGYQRHAPAHVVYQGEHVACPWAGCNDRIEGISFRLEVQGDAAAQARWLQAWWTGPGLVARCPSCGHYVLFGLENKRAVENPLAWGTGVLPDDWYHRAHVVRRAV